MTGMTMDKLAGIISEQLDYLLPEPDRWRGEAWGGHTGPRQELTNLTAANHYIRRLKGTSMISICQGQTKMLSGRAE